MPRANDSTAPAATLRVALSGASGLVGTALKRELEAAGHTVVPMVRGASASSSSCIAWSPARDQVDVDALSSCDAVIHLAGENIAQRWTTETKNAIRNSRVNGTRLVSTAIAKLSSPPPVLVTASAIGFYGERGDEVLDESSPAGDGFLPEVCQAWEEATRPAAHAGTRVVNLRIGVVLSPDGGALKMMLPPFRLGLGGVVGKGTQYMSWISLPDLTRAIQHALLNDALEGAVNAVAPSPVTNREFTKALGRTLRRPTIAPIPATAMRLLFGEMGKTLILGSTRVHPTKLAASGFAFEHSELEPALRTVLNQ